MPAENDSGPGAGRLEAVGLAKKFHELRALSDVDLTLRCGEILGLIGPNGSGKTTFINVVTGHLPPTAGRVFADGVDLTGKAPHHIARAGVARTFQRVRLFTSLSVLENVVIAAMSVGIARREATADAHALLARFGMDRWADTAADTLPYGHERLVEVARALAMRPKFLLLDEPAAGLDESESGELLKQLSAIPEGFDLGMLIVDHDMHLIMRLCHRLHVLNYGNTIAEGTPDEVRRHPAVVEAYLGGEAAEETHAGA